jgi:hypothetical protein
VGNATGRRLFADLTLLGAYEFEQSEWGAIVADGRVSPWGLGETRVSAGWHPEKRRWTEVLGDWMWSHHRGHALNLGYRYVRDVPDVFEDFGSGRFDDFEPADRVHEATGGFRAMVSRNWRLEYRVAYSFEQSLLLGNRGLVEYLSKCGCWAAGVEVSQDRARGFELKVLYRLIGLGRDRPEDHPSLLD